MSFYKFGPNDIFHNVIKTYPRTSFFFYSGSVYHNNKPVVSGAFTSTTTHVPAGNINLYELNVDRPSGELIYPFVTKNGTLTSFKTITTGDFDNSAKFGYGDSMTGSYPLSASVTKEYYVADSDRVRITALKNTLNYYTPSSRHYNYTSSFGDKSTQALGLISIPSIFYGSSVKKGSVNLKYYVTGTLAGELKDSGSIAGVVLYNEGFVVLTGSWDVSPHKQKHDGTNLDQSKWIYFGQTISGSVSGPGTSDHSSSYSMDFKGTNYVPVLTMLAHAPAAELNYSANPTYIEHGQTITPQTGTAHYIENRDLNIKNTVSSSYPDPTGSFVKQTFISKIGLFDEKKNLIGFAKLAKPIKKTQERDFTFKLKLDF